MKKQNKKAKKQKLPKILPEFLNQMTDFRRGQGKMHNLTHILLIVIMSIMSGYIGQRPTADFVKKNKLALIKTLKPKNNKLPSYQTIARVMQNLDYDKFTKVFFEWTKTVVPIKEKEWASMDGKAIAGTLANSGTPMQTFTNLVSLFSSKSKQVITQGKVKNKTNEIPLVAELI